MYMNLKNLGFQNWLKKNLKIRPIIWLNDQNVSPDPKDVTSEFNNRKKSIVLVC